MPCTRIGPDANGNYRWDCWEDSATAIKIASENEGWSVEYDAGANCWVVREAQVPDAGG